MVSLAFLPSAERLTVVVIKARNLRVVDDTRTSSGMHLWSKGMSIKKYLARVVTCFKVKLKLENNVSQIIRF